jgi:hypothetical protein
MHCESSLSDTLQVLAAGKSHSANITTGIEHEVHKDPEYNKDAIFLVVYIIMQMQACAWCSCVPSHAS